MPMYTPPLRDMQFVMHEVFKVTDEFKAMPPHAEVDVDTINAVIEEAGKFAAEVAFPLNISGAVEFDDRTGPVRDALASSVMTWHAAMRRAIEQCKDCGELRPDTNEEQMLFEIHGLILALHYEARFLQNPGSIERAVMGFQNILARYRTEGAAARAAPSAKAAPAAHRPAAARRKVSVSTTTPSKE